jgi:hypothetical protein
MAEVRTERSESMVAMMSAGAEVFGSAARYEVIFEWSSVMRGTHETSARDAKAESCAGDIGVQIRGAKRAEEG